MGGKDDTQIFGEAFYLKGNLEEASRIDQQSENISIGLPSYIEKVSEDIFDFVEPSEIDSKDIQDNKSIITLNKSIVKDDSVDEENLDVPKLSEESNVILKHEPKQRVGVQIPSTDTSEIHKEQEVNKDITKEESLAKKINSSEIKQDIELKEETYLVEGETFKKEKSVISNMAEEVSVVLTDVPQQREDNKDVQDNKSDSTLDTSIVKDDSIEEENLDFSKLSEESNIILKDEPKQRAEVQIPSTDTSEIHKEQEVNKDITKEESLAKKIKSSELKQ